MLGKQFIISGRQTLSGNYKVQGNKNAALPLISACLLTRSVLHLHNVPRIADVDRLLQLLQGLNVHFEWNDQTLSIDSSQFKAAELPTHLVEKLRGSILLLGGLAPLLNQISSALPGGCPIGRRSFDVHWDVFRSAGFSVLPETNGIRLERRKTIETPRVYLEESSVTATENALILFSSLGRGIIENPAREPHVLSLIEFLRLIGAKIELHPLYYRIHESPTPQTDEVNFRVPADYIDAGTIAIASAVTGGEIELNGIQNEEFSPIQHIFERFGLIFEHTSPDSLKVRTSKLTNPSKITAGLWPSFPTDLVSLAIILATQGDGLCLIHDWMYESRMFFIDKVVRMGANITMCDPHRVLIQGPSRLKGTSLESPDIRAGMALVVAGLCAEGVTTIEHAEIIQRGYENVATRLSSIGAEISEKTD